MSNVKFDEFVDRLLVSDTAAEEGWIDERDLWLRYLEQFYNDVDSYVKSYVAQGKLKVVHGTKTIDEELIGEYSVPTRAILIGTYRVRLDPIGANIIGAHGRIDMIGPYGKSTFLLVNSGATSPRMTFRILDEGEMPPGAPKEPADDLRWKIATLPPDMQYLDVTEDSFLEVLMEITNG
jgi:hypothetical protein